MDNKTNNNANLLPIAYRYQYPYSSNGHIPWFTIFIPGILFIVLAVALAIYQIITYEAALLAYHESIDPAALAPEKPWGMILGISLPIFLCGVIIIVVGSINKYLIKHKKISPEVMFIDEDKDELIIIKRFKKHHIALSRITNITYENSVDSYGVIKQHQIARSYGWISIFYEADDGGIKKIGPNCLINDVEIVYRTIKSKI